MKLINILKEIKVTPPFTFTTIEQLEKHIRLYPVFKQDLVGAVYDAADLANDDYFASCPDYANQDGANDIVYQFTNGANDRYIDISLCENITNYDCQLYIFENNCNGNPSEIIR